MSQEPDVDVTEAVEVRPSVNQDGFPNTPELTGNFQDDIQAIAAEQGVSVSTENEVPMPEPEAQPEPAQPEADKGSAEAEVTQEEKPDIPEKFQDENGDVDVSKVEKATMSAEEALLKYQELEKDLHRKQNQAHQQKQEPNTEPEAPQVQLNAPQGESLDTIAKQIEDEIKLNGTGVALAKLMNAISESTYQRSQADLSGLQGTIEGQKQRAELQRIAEQDSWVLSEKGFDTLTQLRQENPWLNQAPSPWQAALEFAKGRGLAPSSKTQSKSGSPNPTPEGHQVVTPPSGARNVTPPTPTNEINNKDSLFKKLDSMTPEQERDFWRSQGIQGWNQ